MDVCTDWPLSSVHWSENLEDMFSCDTAVGSSFWLLQLGHTLESLCVCRRLIICPPVPLLCLLNSLISVKILNWAQQALNAMEVLAYLFSLCTSPPHPPQLHTKKSVHWFSWSQSLNTCKCSLVFLSMQPLCEIMRCHVVILIRTGNNTISYHIICKGLFGLLYFVLVAAKCYVSYFHIKPIDFLNVNIL